MIIVTISWPVALVALVLAATFAFVMIRRERMIERFGNALEHAKPIVAALCIPAGFLLVELPYNDRLTSMDPRFALLGLLLSAVLFLLVYFAGQRSKTSMMAYLAICFLAGVANHYVAVFKGQPILPSDIAALQTAAAVSGGYTYQIDDAVAAPFLIIMAFACVMPLLPKNRLSKRSVVLNCAIAVAVAAGSCAWYTFSDIERDLKCSVDVWSSLDSYKEHGALLCFLQRAQKITPSAPEGYSHEAAEALRTALADDKTLETIGLADEAAAIAPDVRPSIVVIMNETFSDISAYEAVDDSYGGLENYRAIAQDALLSGNAYVSALGGGTCNSEFEFLTGSTAGLLGAGVYPYMLYDLEGVDNLAAYLASLGYSTTAIHPAEAQNWRRDRVYAQLGFQRFLDIEAFEDAETRRGLVTDEQTYDLVADLLSAEEAPQFIFDVTIASHGGYETGLIPENDFIGVNVQGEQDPEASEFASCMALSDKEFASFIDSLADLDRPVVVCMFGDHQPGFADRLAEASEGVSVGSMSIEQTQERYTTPYLIWTNSEELRRAYGVGDKRDLSLNYLAANLLKASGLPLDEQFSYLLSAEKEIPAINLNGYQDSDGVWRWHGESGPVDEAYRDLSIVQHDNLFDREE